MKRHVSSILLVLLALVFGTNCKTTQPREDLYPTTSPSAQILETWISGDEESARRAVDDIDREASPRDLFAAAEVDFWSGDVERAFERYVAMFEQNPGHPLNRFAAARLYGLRSDVVNYEERIAPLLETVRYGDVEPLGRVYLSLAAQNVRYDQWQTLRRPEPFSADALGFSARWMTTPVISPWRLTDFDREFSPETGPSLAEEYLSPYTAEDDPVNYEESRPFISNGMSLSPPFESNGVHYIETFATVEPSEEGGPRDYLVYVSGAGAVKVWIDGKLVAEREEGEYGTNKRLRRVRLAPGEHRILVKLAYQSGYRDWFDFVLLGDDASPLEGSGITFQETRQSEGSLAKSTVEGDMMLPDELEPSLVPPEDVEDAGTIELYLTALAGYLDLQPEYFEPAWSELMERHDGFAAGYSLHAYQVQTMWEIPSRIRDARALSSIREAHEHDPDSLAHLERLIYWLRQQGGDQREVEGFLEQARNMSLERDGEGDARIRSIGPLVTWADYVGDKGWTETAETAWARVLELNPRNCRAAVEMQGLYYNRNYYPALDQITPASDHCPRLEDRLLRHRTDRDARKLELLDIEASRNPYNTSTHIRLAEELVAQSKTDQARAVLLSARERMPWSLTLWSELANLALASDGEDAALDILRKAIDENGQSAWLAWRTALLENDIPLESVMPDGLEAARKEAQRRPIGGTEGPEADAADYVSDDAYYVIDFAAVKYLPDGSSVSLTHTLVRVMTKGAIDRFGERSIPGGARVLLSRTIKQDGTTRTPEQTPGKSTLSMPGLAEGDFVEFAYLEYDSAPSISKTYREGTRFYFRMGNISSLHSEYVLLGELGHFIRQNGAPEAEDIQTASGDGVRLLERDSPRPRKEPHTVSWTEYLPWIQMYRLGVKLEPFEIERRYQHESLVDSRKMSGQLAAQIDAWRADSESGTDGEIRDLFYDVSGWFSERSLSDFSTDASHALIQRDGNPLVVLQAAYERAGIDSDIYVAKSKYQHPEAFPVQEFRTYSVPLMRVRLPGGSDEWIVSDGPDAMFGAVPKTVHGQPAVCLTCVERVETTIPEEGFREASRDIAVDAKLTDSGTLNGTMKLTFDGTRAMAVRRGLRRTTEESARRKYMDRILSSQLPGATLRNYEISDAEEPDKPLVITAEFERTNFARETASGQLRIQTLLFQERLASIYTELSSRTTPMIARFPRDHTYRFKMELPESLDIVVGDQAGERKIEADSAFGAYERTVDLGEDTLVIAAEIDMPIQRISTDDYAAFQAWAVEVEQSALLRATISR